MTLTPHSSTMNSFQGLPIEIIHYISQYIPLSKDLIQLSLAYKSQWNFTHLNAFTDSLCSISPILYNGQLPTHYSSLYINGTHISQMTDFITNFSIFIKEIYIEAFEFPHLKRIQEITVNRNTRIRIAFHYGYECINLKKRMELCEWITMFSKHPQIQLIKLYLHSCQLTMLDTQEILKALVDSRLQVLNLGCNSIGKQGIEYLCLGLQRKENALTEIALYHCGLTRECIDMLMESLIKSREFYLFNSRILNLQLQGVPVEVPKSCRNLSFVNMICH